MDANFSVEVLDGYLASFVRWSGHCFMILDMYVRTYHVSHTYIAEHFIASNGIYELVENQAQMQTQLRTSGMS